MARVEALMAEDAMEWVSGIAVNRKGAEVKVWIPVARFVKSRRWRKKTSFDGLARVAVMQFVSGG